MKRKAFIFLICIFIFTFFLAGCSTTNISKQNDSQSTQTIDNVQNKDTQAVENKDSNTNDNDADNLSWFPRPHLDYLSNRKYLKILSTNLANPSYKDDFNLLDGVFIDPMNGWALTTIDGRFIDDKVCPYSPQELYRTNDGGKTWKRIAYRDKDNIHTDKNGDPSPGVLPVYGEFNDISFLDENRGWMTGRYLTNKNKTKLWLYVTEDGGHTWKHQVLATPPKLPLNINECNIRTNPPVFFNKLDGLMYVDIDKGDAKYAFLYFTHDEGKTWGDIQDVFSYKGVSRNINWAFNDHGIEITIDGDTWISDDTWLNFKKQK